MPTSNMDSKQWSLVDRLKALNIPPLDHERLERASPTQRCMMLMKFGSELSTSGKSLYAIAVIPEIYPTLSQKERQHVRSSRVASKQFLELPEAVREYFILKTGEIRGGNLSALFEVFDRYGGGHETTPSQSRGQMSGVPVTPVKQPMSLQSRLELAGILTYDASKLCTMSGQQKDAYVKQWCLSLNKSGRTLFALQKAPEYAKLSDRRKSKESLSQWSSVLWQKQHENDMRPYKTATARLREGGLETFVHIMSLVLGKLPDLLSNLSGLSSTTASEAAARPISPVASLLAMKRTDSAVFPSPLPATEIEVSPGPSHAVEPSSASRPSETVELPNVSRASVTRAPFRMTASAAPTEVLTNSGFDDWDVPPQDRATISIKARVIKPIRASSKPAVSSEIISSEREPRPVDSLTEIPGGSTPVLDLLVPLQARSIDLQELVSQVLEALKGRIFPRADKVLVGRTADNLRIDYNPMAANVSSISSRLQATMSTECPREAMEAILQPLSKWNAECMFPKLKHGAITKIKGVGGTEAYECTWRFHKAALAKIVPIKLANAASTIGVVYDSMEDRYGKLKGGDKKRKLSLGYLDLLVDCFQILDAASEIYEDRIEAVLYQLEVDTRGPDVLDGNE